jgi:hypothetical protein
MGCVFLTSPISVATGSTNAVTAVIPYTFAPCGIEGVTVVATISTLTLVHISSTGSGGENVFTKVVFQGGEGLGHGGAIDGVPFQINGNPLSVHTILHPDGRVESLDAYSVVLIGQGQAPNYIDRLVVHTTMHPD